MGGLFFRLQASGYKLQAEKERRGAEIYENLSLVAWRLQLPLPTFAQNLRDGITSGREKSTCF